MDFSTIRLSPQVYLYPAGSSVPTSLSPQLGLGHIPSAAFGDGSHPTTRLCAVAVDQLCRSQKISSMLDVGTGTGVLARIARARGVPFVAGTDIDPLALEAARLNARLDVDGTEILFEACMPDHWGARFDLIVANILEQPLLDLAASIAAALTPGAQLLLSGFTRRQTPGLRVHYRNFGLRFVSESEIQGWALLHFQS